MPDRSRKRRPGKKLDINELAKSITDEATGEAPPAEDDSLDDEGKNPAAVALGRLGGLKGGKARAKKLSRAERSESAKHAARARWKSKHPKKKKPRKKS